MPSFPLAAYERDDQYKIYLNRDGTVLPIEVKSGSGPSISLDKLLQNPDVKTGYKLISGNAGQTGKKITMPLYMAMFLI